MPRSIVTEFDTVSEWKRTIMAITKYLNRAGEWFVIHELHIFDPRLPANLAIEEMQRDAEEALQVLVAERKLRYDPEHGYWGA
jgi:hypothetical protein